MYSSLKNIATKILTQKTLRKNEKFFRRIIAVKYAGSKFQCNLCKYNLRHFVKKSNQDLLCPNCGSLSRSRRLYKTLIEFPIKGEVLHFSPPKYLASKFKKMESINYYTSDLVGEFDSEYQFDMTSIALDDQIFDFIICYHILEHIENDILAMKELYRILKPDGCIFIQTPLKEGEIYEDEGVKSKKMRKLAFGQEDHVRVYSLKGLNKRLQAVGFVTEIFKTAGNTSENYNGFMPETYLVAKKQTQEYLG